MLFKFTITQFMCMLVMICTINQLNKFYRNDYTVISESDSAQLGSSSQLVPLTFQGNSVQFQQVW